MPARQFSVRLSVFNLFLFLGMGVQLPFLPLWVVGAAMVAVAFYKVWGYWGLFGTVPTVLAALFFGLVALAASIAASGGASGGASGAASIIGTKVGPRSQGSGLVLLYRRRWGSAVVLGAVAAALLAPWQWWVAAHQGEIAPVLVGT